MKVKDQRWRFVHQGSDPHTQADVLQFDCGKGQQLGLRTLPLFCWPTPTAAASTQAAASGADAATNRHLTLHATDSAATLVAEYRALAAKIRSWGQWA